MHGVSSDPLTFVIAYAVAAFVAVSLLTGAGFVVCIQNRGGNSARNDSGKGRGQ